MTDGSSGGGRLVLFEFALVCVRKTFSTTGTKKSKRSTAGMLLPFHFG